MINRTAFVALSLIMVVSWVFGAVCDRMITRWFNSLSEPSDEPVRHACDTCRYEDTNPTMSPCRECAEDGIDMWEPATLVYCETCKWKSLMWYDEPCDECSCGDNWEADK